MPRLFSSPGSSRETLLFGGPEPNQKSMLESAEDANPCSGLSAKGSAPIRLHVRFTFLRVNTEL